jgi:hypothetical protein
MQPTCFRDTGNVSLPQNSGLLTMSLHIFLQDWQTEAHATTCFREGHVFSLSSSRRMTSNSNSGGKFAQQLFWITRGWSCKSCTDPCDFPLWCWPVSLTSKLRLDKLPKLSRTSRTMLRNDILQEDPKNNYMNISSLNDIHPTTASICLPSKENFSSTVK